MSLKKITAILFTTMFIIAAYAEDLHIKDLIDSPNAADNWQGEQYKRSKELYKEGKYKKGEEVAEYADDRTERVKGAVDFYENIVGE